MPQPIKLYTEVPVFDLSIGGPSPTKRSFSEWEPPVSLNNVLMAIDELDGNEPPSILVETEIHSLAIHGGPSDFMAICGDGKRVTHFLAKGKIAKENESLWLRIEGARKEFSARFALTKEEVIILATRFVQGEDSNLKNEFVLEVNDL